MEARVWAMLAAFLFIACFAAGVSYYFEIDSRRDALGDALADVKAVQEGVDNARFQAEEAREKLEKSKSVEKLFTAKAELKTAVEDLKKKRAAAVEAYKKSVEDLRALAVGTSWPEFTRGSQTIRNARIQKITETEVTFAHDEGVAKLSGDALPDAVRERFRLEMFPMLSEEPPAASVAEATGSQSRPAPVATSVTNATVTPTPAAAPESASMSLKLQIEIDANEVKMITLARHREDWLARARGYRDQANLASLKGRPAYAFNQQVQQAEQNADLCSAQIDRLDQKNRELRKKQLDSSSVVAP